MESGKIIRDPIYGFIETSSWEQEIIDHPAFQRLRNIKQMSLTNMVYPSANHTRFEHSLGVMHLSSLMFDRIVKDDRNIALIEECLDIKNFDKEEQRRQRQIVRLAGLLHDIGHAPFAHSGEAVMPLKSNGKKSKHEDYTVKIVNDVLESMIEDNGKNEFSIECAEISALIGGKPSDPLSCFWKDLISGLLDADRGDYLLRDSHHLGVAYGSYDYHRMLATIIVGKPAKDEAERIRIGVHSGGFQLAESVIIARYKLLTQVSLHPVRRAYDHHLKRAMGSIFEGGYLPSIDEIEEYILNDDVTTLAQIITMDNEDCLAIKNRNHIKRVWKPANEVENTEKTRDCYCNVLNDRGIESIPLDVNSTLYKLDEREIMIIDKDTREASQLSNKSAIIKSMRPIERYEIFVKGECKKDAIEIIRKAKRNGGDLNGIEDEWDDRGC